MTDKKRRLIHLIISAALIVPGLFFSIPCACLTAAASAALLIFYERLLAERRDEVMRLCDNIDRILYSSEQITFHDYQEGELSVLSAEIHKMTIRLREQNAALLHEKQFAKEALEDISHQIRTPLTSVMMILGLMRAPDLTDKCRMEYLGDLYTLLERMKWLIETMLSLSRIEADAARFEKEPVSCRELLARSVDTVSVTAELKGVRIRTEITGEPVFFGDMHYTSEAIVNLLKNAIEHTPTGGTVSVSSAATNIAAEITIADSGEGIPESELPHIFERFYRSAEYTKNGFGIGLAFAKKVIAAQEGKIRVFNQKPHGAVFQIRFYLNVV